MIELASMPLIVLVTSSLIAGFVYYNIKYRKLSEEHTIYPSTIKIKIKKR